MSFILNVQRSCIFCFTLFSFCLSFFFLPIANGQSYYNGSYVRSEVDYDGYRFTVFSFSRKKNKKGTVKAKYFAQNAYRQFSKWKNGKKILFYCSGAFSESWDSDGIPLGICVDNGVIVNKNLDSTMDGLVIVYNGGKQQGGIAVINIDKESVTVSQGKTATYNLRTNSDKLQFLHWAANQDATVFQTQLMYTNEFGYGFSDYNLKYGNKAERRFLAICIRKGVVYHIVIDHPKSDYLNRSAKRVASYLTEELKLNVVGLFNLDTGGKNIMTAYDDDGDRIDRATESVSKATNLVVYYID